MRLAFVIAMAAFLGAAMAVAEKPQPKSDEDVRRIATEVACRTIVEAGLVKSCTVAK